MNSPIAQPRKARTRGDSWRVCEYSSEIGTDGGGCLLRIFTSGTNHFAHSGKPDDAARSAEYDRGPYAGLSEQSLKALASLEPADADAASVAEGIVQVVDTEFGKRPFRLHIDPSRDGCEEVSEVGDRIRSQFLHRIGLEDLLSPRAVVPSREGLV